MTAILANAQQISGHIEFILAKFCILFYSPNNLLLVNHASCSVVMQSVQWSFPVTVGFTILAIRTVLLSAIVLFIRVISCDIVYI